MTYHIRLLYGPNYCLADYILSGPSLLLDLDTHNSSTFDTNQFDSASSSAIALYCSIPFPTRREPSRNNMNTTLYSIQGREPMNITMRFRINTVCESTFHIPLIQLPQFDSAMGNTNNLL